MCTLEFNPDSVGALVMRQLWTRPIFHWPANTFAALFTHYKRCLGPFTLGLPICINECSIYNFIKLLFWLVLYFIKTLCQYTLNRFWSYNVRTYEHWRLLLIHRLVHSDWLCSLVIFTLRVIYTYHSDNI